MKLRDVALFGRDSAATKQRIKPGTILRIATYTRGHGRRLVLLLILTVVNAVVAVANPLLLKAIIDRGVIPRNASVVIGLTIAVAAVALIETVIDVGRRWYSAKIGEGVTYDLRVQAFDHVQRMPVAFFMRTPTGSLVSRLNGDVIGAQRALTATLSSVVSSVISLLLVLGTMCVLSWQVTLIVLVLLPTFMLAAKMVGRPLQRVTREQMQLDAEISSLMTERFNAGGATLTKLFGRPAEESSMFSDRARRVRDIGVVAAMQGHFFFAAMILVASLATALVYGFGGVLSVNGHFQVGTLVALATLLTRTYGPLTALSNVHVEVMTALVSFDRVFEILDFKPMIPQKPGARPLNAKRPPEVEFEAVSFRYPATEEVSLASLESVARIGSSPCHQVLRGVDFRVAPGTMTALVGPSGAGKTTITALVSRLYDPTEGTVRIGGRDIRDVTNDSLRHTVGVVTQDVYLFHDSIRANLSYARPEATEEELIEALASAQVWDLIAGLPDGLDTVVGDQGCRLSGGEKQRLAIARLLLKAPSVVVLDEATAHLDAENEVAVQRALRIALAGRTSIVVAHRLSTIREADQILVLEEGQVTERGRHAALLDAGGVYSRLYQAQFARQAEAEHFDLRPVPPVGETLRKVPFTREATR